MSNTQYFLGWEVKLNGSKKTELFLREQIISKEVLEHKAISSGTYLELNFDDSGKLENAVAHSPDGPITDSFTNDVKKGKQRFVDYPVNTPHEFVPDKKGINYIGGEPPKYFVMPSTSSGLPVQYLGMLNHHDPAFGWILEFDLHLVCPIFLGFPELWVDYSDPFKPVILRDKKITAESSSFAYTTESEIVFNKIDFSTKPWPTLPYGGHSGVASWVQMPNIPVCPKSGEPMKLVCQLGDADLFLYQQGEEIKSVIPTTLRHNFEIDEDRSYLQDYLEKMNFWSSGDLYVHYCPASKVARYLIQNT